MRSPERRKEESMERMDERRKDKRMDERRKDEMMEKEGGKDRGEENV
jgi:hypothetical protein